MLFFKGAAIDFNYKNIEQGILYKRLKILAKSADEKFIFGGNVKIWGHSAKNKLKIKVLNRKKIDTKVI